MRFTEAGNPVKLVAWLDIRVGGAALTKKGYIEWVKLNPRLNKVESINKLVS